MEHEIYFATTNSSKVKSLQIYFSEKIKILQVKLELPEPRADDLRLIARVKVLFACEHIDHPCIALDAGFFIPSLNGFPKAFVNFFLETIGLEGLLKLVEDKDRSCYFKNCLAYYDGKISEPIYFESDVPGTLATEILGQDKSNAWSVLWKIFIPAGKTQTIAQMSNEEYLSWRQERGTESFGAKFAAWYLSQK